MQLLNITVAELVREFQPTGILNDSPSESPAVLSGISAVEDCQAGDLVFVDKKDYIPLIEARRPAAVVTSNSLKPAFQALKGIEVLVAPNVSLAHALIKQRYAGRNFQAIGWSEPIHSSAVLHPTAQIGEGTWIEPQVVIAQGVRIGRNCRIMAGAIIENDVVIEDETIIHPRATIGYSCRLGRQVVIGAGSVIGSEGYGFAQDRQRKSYPIPQTGIVVIEDRVRVGANCCIDRATYHETRIGAGTKIDNLCHIAHNVRIGQDCLLTSMLCVAGSSTIGNRVMTSGQTGILDHINICDDTALVHRAGVTKDIEKPGAYAGLPLQPLGDYMKNAAAMRTLAEMRKRLATLEKQFQQDGSMGEPGV